MENKFLFNVGDKVDKIAGYKFPGTIVSAFITTSGKVRYVVEMDNYGLLHIFNEDNLTLIENKNENQTQ